MNAGQYRLAILLVLMGYSWMPVPVRGAASPSATAPELTVTQLRCEHLENPVGIDVAQPRLSWVLKSPRRGESQSAYRVLVASRRDLLDQDQGDLWDSGKVASDQTLHVEYAGKPLASRQRCHWKVQSWGKDGRASAWSPPAIWGMGLLKPQDWQAKWIGAGCETGEKAVYLRREVDVTKPVTSAVVFFSGLGFSELAINGKKVGDYVVGPEFTDYGKRVPYLGFDVSEHFNAPGRKKLDVVLVNGWYALKQDPWVHKFEKNAYVDRPKLLLHLRLQHPDGTETVIVSDEQWQWSEGEITRSWIVAENVDARKGSRQWQPAVPRDAPKGKLFAQHEPFNRIVEEVRPVSCRYDAVKKSAVWDFGREISGCVRLSVRGPAGTMLKVTTFPSDPRPRTSLFTLAGTGEREVYQPRFFYSAMRRVEVTGLGSEPKVEDLTGCVISSMQTASGSFACSDEFQTWINEATRRTVVQYTTFLPNDPVREYKAWTQDIQGMFKSAVYLFDSLGLYERYQRAILDSQTADGNCANVIGIAKFDAYNSPWWGGCVVWLPWHWYQYYGDPGLLRQSFPAMKRYVDFLGKTASKGMQDWGLLDWGPVEETPREIINTPAHFLYAQIVSRTAQLLGQAEDATRYAAIAEEVRTAFNQRFLDPVSGIYGQPGWDVKPGGQWGKGKMLLEQFHEVWWSSDRPCTQAGQGLPLVLGMVPEASRPAAEKALLREIAAHRNHLSTGFVSTPYLLELLADLDPEMGWKVTSARDYPSWYSMTRGSGNDLLKENFNGSGALMPSQGGNIAVWHTEALAGIRPGAPGFKRIVIKPALVGDLTWVKAHHDSPYGRIESAWKRDGQGVQLDVTIPANTTATVYLPTADVSSVTESGQPADKAEGVQFLQMQNGRALYEVGSGSYRFKARLPAVR